MDAAAKVTSKGQVTVPKSVRDALGIKEGDQVVFRVAGNRAMLARTLDFLDLAGTVVVPAPKPQRRMGRRDPRDGDGAGGSTSVSAFVDTNALIPHLTGHPSHSQ